jgi:hypothetical protein
MFNFQPFFLEFIFKIRAAIRRMAFETRFHAGFKPLNEFGIPQVQGSAPMACVALNVSQVRLLKFHGKAAGLLESRRVADKTVRVMLS